MPDHQVAVELVLEALVDAEHGVIEDADEIGAVGHRVLHGGQVYSKSIVVNDDVKKVIKDCFPLGPLHNPANLIGIEACEKALPGKPQVAVFVLLSIRQCRRKLICMQYHMTGMKNMASEDMVSMVRAMHSFQKEQLNSQDWIRKTQK